MRTSALIHSSICLCLLAACLTLPARAERGLTLEVQVTGFRREGGELALALFDSETAYEAREPAVRKAWVPVADGRAQWTVDNLPAGEYTVIAYHDENGNRELDYRLFGIPKEKVGISNNVRGAFGPPRFERAKFALTEPVTVIEIELQ